VDKETEYGLWGEIPEPEEKEDGLPLEAFLSLFQGTDSN
jgi:hypothetical protein